MGAGRTARHAQPDGQSRPGTVAQQPEVPGFERERWLWSIFQALPDCVKLIDADNRLLEMNPAGLAMIRAPGPGAVRGRCILDVIAPEHQEAFARLTREVFAGRNGSLEFHVIGFDGKRRPFSTRSVPLRDDTGRVTAALSITRDLSEERGAEAAHRESQRLLALLVRRSPLGIIVWKPDFTVGSWNDAAERIFGYTEREAVGMHASAIVPAHVRPSVNAVWSALLHAAGGERSLNENVTRDGRTIICDWHNAPLRGEDGAVIGVASMVEEVTEEVRARREVEQNEQNLRTLTDAIPAIIVYIDHDLKYRFANRAFEEWIDTPRSRLVGKSPGEVLGDVFDADAERRMREALAGRTVRFERLAHGPRGARDLEVIYAPRTVDGRVVGFYVVAFDISARKANERELVKYREGLEALVRERTRQLNEQSARLRSAEQLASLGTLAAGLGHDMNNMLLPMRCAFDALASSSDPAEIALHRDALRRSIEFLSWLATGLLTLSTAPDTANHAASRSTLARWWARDGAMFTAAAAGAGATLSLDLPADTPDLAIETDHLTRAVLNLIVNAAEAAGPTGDIRLWARAERADNPPRTIVALAVSDNGPGMPADVLSRAAEPFFTTKKRGLGTGLGLSLVHAIAKAAGGSVRIDSSPGRGTTVFLLIPAAAGDAAATSEPLQHRSALVTIADDRVAGFILALLQARGYTARRGDLGASPDAETLWITDPSPVALAHMASVAATPSPRVVVLGESPGAGFPARATLIKDPADIAAIAAAID